MDSMTPGGKCGCKHHKVPAVGLILIGLAFLLQTFNILTAAFVSVAWPIIVIVIGFSKLGMCKCCK